MFPSPGNGKVLENFKHETGRLKKKKCSFKKIALKR
jgi:hypothetical protein